MKLQKLTLILAVALFSFFTPDAKAQEISVEVLKESFVEINKTLPSMFDNDTRLDRVEAGYGEALFFFTFINQTYDNFEWEAFSAEMTAIGKRDYCNNPDMAYFKNGGVGVNYLYYDRNGEFIGSTVIPRYSC